jgi:hypothetical protein
VNNKQDTFSIQNVPLASVLNILSTEEDLETLSDHLVEFGAVPENDEGCFILPTSLLIEIVSEELPNIAEAVRQYFKKHHVDLQGSYVDVSGLFF